MGLATGTLTTVGGVIYDQAGNAQGTTWKNGMVESRIEELTRDDAMRASVEGDALLSQQGGGENQIKINSLSVTDTMRDAVLGLQKISGPASEWCSNVAAYCFRSAESYERQNPYGPPSGAGLVGGIFQGAAGLFSLADEYLPSDKENAELLAQSAFPTGVAGRGLNAAGAAVAEKSPSVIKNIASKIWNFGGGTRGAVSAAAGAAHGTSLDVGVETNNMSGEELAEYGLKSFSVRTAVNFVSNGLGSGKMTGSKAIGLFGLGVGQQLIMNIGSKDTNNEKAIKTLWSGTSNLGGTAIMKAGVKSNNLPRQQPSIGFNIVGGSLVAMAFSSPVLVYTAWVKSREAKERRK
jgi:hypothetical protein